MSKFKKEGSWSKVWNKIFTNVLIFYYLKFSPLFEFFSSIAILCYFYCYTFVSILILCIVNVTPCIFGFPPRFPMFLHWFLMVCGKFPEWHFPEDKLQTDTSPTDISPMEIFLNGQFPNRTVSRWRLPRPDISPLRHFPDWALPQPDISLTKCFSAIFS